MAQNSRISYVRIDVANNEKYNTYIQNKVKDLINDNDFILLDKMEINKFSIPSSLFYFFTKESYGLSLFIEYAFVYGLIETKKLRYTTLYSDVVVMVESSYDTGKRNRSENFLNENLQKKIQTIDEKYRDNIQQYVDFFSNSVLGKSIQYDDTRETNPFFNSLNSTEIGSDKELSVDFYILSRYFISCAYYFGCGRKLDFVETLEVIKEKMRGWKNKVIVNNKDDSVSSNSFIMLKQKKEISDAYIFLKKLFLENKKLVQRNKKNIENLIERKKKYNESSLSRRQIASDISRYEKNMNQSNEQRQRLQKDIESIKIEIEKEELKKKNIEKQLSEKKNQLRKLELNSWSLENETKLKRYEKNFEKLNRDFKTILDNINEDEF